MKTHSNLKSECVAVVVGLGVLHAVKEAENAKADAEMKLLDLIDENQEHALFLLKQLEKIVHLVEQSPDVMAVVGSADVEIDADIEALSGSGYTSEEISTVCDLMQTILDANSTLAAHGKRLRKRLLRLTLDVVTRCVRWCKKTQTES